MQILAEALSKQYGNGFAALKEIQLSIGKGMFGLLGPNGAGKTTLMRIICTLLPASSGRLSVLGLDAARSAQQIRSRLGYLPQEFSAYPSLTGQVFL